MLSLIHTFLLMSCKALQKNPLVQSQVGVYFSCQALCEHGDYCQAKHMLIGSKYVFPLLPDTALIKTFLCCRSWWWQLPSRFLGEALPRLGTAASEGVQRLRGAWLPGRWPVLTLTQMELLAEKWVKKQLWRKAKVLRGVLQSEWFRGISSLPSAALWLDFPGTKDARRWKEKGLCGLSFFPKPI